MRLKDINAEISFDLWMQPELSGESLNIGVGYITPNYDGQVYKLRIDGQQWSLRLRDVSVGKDLNFHLKRGCAHLAEVMQVAKDGSALVKIVFFNGEIVEIGDVEIGIDEHITDTAKRSRIRFNGPEQLGNVLSEKCIINVSGDDFFLLMSGPSARADFEANTGGYEDSVKFQTVVQEKYREFSIYGERVRIPVERRNVDNSTEIYYATKVVFNDNQKSEGSMRLARGAIQFTDYTKTGRIRALAAGAMARLTRESGSYLKQWDQYGEIEGEMLLERAKSVGRIDYHSAERTGKGFKFFAQNIPDQLTVGDVMEITSEEPIYLKNTDLTWEAYSKALEEEFTSTKFPKKNDPDYAPIINRTKNSIELGTDQNGPQDSVGQKFLILSINGDKIQIERRMRARSTILEGRSANPLLGLLIEEGGILPDIQRVTKLKPLTSFVKDKIFKHPPTDRQVEAIDVALSTPDIALIQGPPGTGKTTVVTAIIERINEEYDKTKSIRGQILVSGFQHDAVENIVAKLSVNALPAIKFGKRSGYSEDSITEKINNWCSDVAEKIRIKNPQIFQTENQKRLAELFRAYFLCPSKSNTVSLVERILDLPRDVISGSIVDEANMIKKAMQSDLQPNDLSTLRLVRALRISKVAYEDDGAARAVDLLVKIEDKLGNSDLDILQKAVRWRSGEPLSFLPDLKRLKESLLYKFLPMPDFRTEKPREDVLNLVANVSKLLEKKLDSGSIRDAILAEFLHELDNNPDGARNAIEDYSFVYAATTQQAFGGSIISSKKKYVRDDQRREMVKYDTVIIDEAARTSPRDLLIPMSQAEKRIILVGDHRQLPHLIDEEIARVLESDESSSQQGDLDFLKNSMFEYLFNRLKKLEEKDDIKRTVTLDAQYRTHPLLGDFVSNNFYRKHKEDYRSPLSESHFEQHLRGIANKAAIWIDVPNSQGPEKVLPNRSRQRVTEAETIAEYVNKWIGSEEGYGLSFGVISFYKAQVSAVYNALEKFDITEKAHDGALQICREYSFLENGEERLRIGTVDAFQGMEFDIVFLSMVRSHDLNALPPHIRSEKDYNKKQRKLFGHLMSENRLCVSMSRQKKVLAIVGNGTFVNAQIAIDAVPALRNFYNLCHEQGVIL